MSDGPNTTDWRPIGWPSGPGKEDVPDKKYTALSGDELALIAAPWRIARRDSAAERLVRRGWLTKGMWGYFRSRRATELLDRMRDAGEIKTEGDW